METVLKSQSGSGGGSSAEALRDEHLGFRLKALMKESPRPYP